MRGEASQVDRATIVEAEIPVAGRIAGPEPARTAKHNGDRTRHGGQHIHEFGDRLGQIRQWECIQLSQMG